MRRLIALLMVAALAGCLSREPANPPKVVVDRLGEGPVTIFVHSAFGDRRYDSIVLRIDNETVASRTNAFSLEFEVDRPNFFLDVSAESGTSSFTLVATFAPSVDRPDRLDVSLRDKTEEWSEPRAYSLPYERILERPTERP
jgi:hypothetical protein